MGIAPWRATYAGPRGDEDVGIARKNTPPAPGLHEDVGIAPSRATYAGPRRDEDVGIARPRLSAPAKIDEILETPEKDRPAAPPRGEIYSANDKITSCIYILEAPGLHPEDKDAKQ